MCCVAKSRHETGCRGHHKLRQSLLTLAKNVLPAKSHVALLSCCRLPEGVRSAPFIVCRTCSPCCPLCRSAEVGPCSDHVPQPLLVL